MQTRHVQTACKKGTIRYLVRIRLFSLNQKGQGVDQRKLRNQGLFCLDKDFHKEKGHKDKHLKDHKDFHKDKHLRITKSFTRTSVSKTRITRNFTRTSISKIKIRKIRRLETMV